MITRVLVQQVRDLYAKNARYTSFTLEVGRGETYRSVRPTLYAHQPYPRSSVLSGQTARIWVTDWGNKQDAIIQLGEVKREVRKFKYDDWFDDGGTSHVPVDQVLDAAGLHDDDY